MQTLRLLQDVARCHSFSQAASLHGITQSAASQRIGHLEKKLGVTLIDRSVRPLRLTDAGRVYLAGVEDILDRYDRLERRVAMLREEPAGEVRVAAIYSAGIDLMRGVQKAFENRFPKARVSVHYEHPEGVYERVLDQGCELGIVSYPQRWRKVEVVPLRDETMVVVVAPEHELAGYDRVPASELKRWSLAAFDVDLPVGRRVRQYLKEHGELPAIAASFDNIDTLKSAVRVTDQFAILPRRTVAREVAAGELVAVPLDPRLVRPMGIIHRRHPAGHADGLSATARRLIDFLVEHAGPRADLPPAAQHQAESSQPEPHQTASSQSEPGHDESSQDESSRAGPGQVEPHRGRTGGSPAPETPSDLIGARS